MNEYLSNPIFWLHYFRVESNIPINTLLSKGKGERLSIQERKQIEFLEKYGFLEFDSASSQFIRELYKQGIPEEEIKEYNLAKIRIEEYNYLRIKFAVIGEYVELGYNSFINLGYDDPHFNLPVFRWEELQQLIKYSEVVIKNDKYPRPRTNFDIKYLPLLLLKFASYETVSQADYKAFLQTELELIDVFQEDELPILIDLISSTWLSKDTEIPTKWREDEQLGWINDFRHSRRNPENKNISEAGFKKIKRFFFKLTQATNFRERQQQTVRCKGFLGGSSKPFVQSTNEALTMTRSILKIKCCNQLVCFYCNYPIKTWDNYWLYAPTQEEREQLYYCKSPSDLPFVEKGYDESRIYSCMCWTDTITSWDELGPYEGIASWECGGH